MTTGKYNSSELFKVNEALSQDENILSTLIRSVIFLKAGNVTRVNNLLSAIIKKDFLQHILNSEIENMPIDMQLSMSRSLLKELRSELDNTRLVDILIYYLYINTRGEYRDMLDDEFSIDVSMSFVRKNYKSITFGAPYKYVWLTAVFENGSKKELLKLFDLYSLFQENKLTKNSDLLFFRYLNNLDTSYKDKILNSFKTLSSSEEQYEQIAYTRILEDENFYRYIQANTSQKLGLLMNIKRKIYQSLLRMNKAVGLSTLQLLVLGDTQIEVPIIIKND